MMMIIIIIIIIISTSSNSSSSSSSSSSSVYAYTFNIYTLADVVIVAMLHRPVAPGRRRLFLFGEFATQIRLARFV